MMHSRRSACWACLMLAASAPAFAARENAEGDSGAAPISEMIGGNVVGEHWTWKDPEPFSQALPLMEKGQDEQAAKLIDKDWVETFAPLIRETKPGAFTPGIWGFSRAKGNTMYLFIRNWHPGGCMMLPTLDRAIINKSFAVHAGGKISLKWQKGVEIFNVPADRHPVGTVVSFDVKGNAVDCHKVHVPDWRKPWAQAPPAAVQAWRDMRFGLFVHWGPCALAGKEISWSRKASKMGRLRYGGSGVDGKYKTDPVYDNLYKQFNPTGFDAEQWVRMVQQAGMKYIVLTAKHCDGFCLWDSKQTDYDIMSTPYGKDIVAQLADACHEHGIKLGLYYSPRDWWHPDFGSTERHSRYLDFYMKQLEELATDYGKVDVLWFDGLDSPQYLWNDIPEKSLQMLRAKQPDIMVNDRGGMLGTFNTAEQRIGGFDRDFPWESCVTIGSGWSWNPRTATKTKSLKHCVQTLVRTAGRDGNLLLNLGPKADGTFEPVQSQRLKEVGDWLKVYGESIYGTRGGPFRPAANFVSTCKAEKIYLHLMADQNAIELPTFGYEITACRVLGGGRATYRKIDQGWRVTLQEVPKDETARIDQVVELTIGGPAMTIRPMAPVRTEKR